MEPKQIRTRFEKYGNVFTLDRNSGPCAIYNRSDGSYEVVVYFIAKDGRWLYPGSTMWGTRGWSYLPEQKDKMEKKFSEICSKYSVCK